MQLLFQEDVSQAGKPEVAEDFWKCHPTDLETRLYAERLFREAMQQRTKIDEAIRRHAKRWSLERMASVDRNVLRAALAEYLVTETPRAVVIDEAIEIARKFGSDKSPDFVNGILDAAMNDIKRSAE